VAYYSVRLRNKENEWSATELEAMGLVYAMRHWSRYLRVQRFTAITDHQALLWLLLQPAKTANGRILHWISDLLEFDFVVYHQWQTHLDADTIVSSASDLPPRYPDSTDIADPVTGPVDTGALATLSQQLRYQGTFMEITLALLDKLQTDQPTGPVSGFLRLLLDAAGETDADNRSQRLQEARDLLPKCFPMHSDPTSGPIPLVAPHADTSPTLDCGSSFLMASTTEFEEYEPFNEDAHDHSDTEA
jgi:hypothetical protein